MNKAILIFFLICTGCATSKKEATVDIPQKESTLKKKFELKKVTTKKKLIFKLGEEFKYIVQFKGFNAASITLKTESLQKINNKDAYLIKGEVKTRSLFKIYNIDLEGESIFDLSQFFSHRFKAVGNEGSQYRNQMELYDYSNKSVHIFKGEQKKTFLNVLNVKSQDPLSLFYYLRTLSYKTKKSFSIPLIQEKKTSHIKLEVVSEEIIQTPLGNILCWKIKALSGNKDAPGEQFFWISKENPIIYKIELSTKWGVVKILLDSKN